LKEKEFTNEIKKSLILKKKGEKKHKCKKMEYGLGDW
jgi:hypothetical protein